MERPKILTPYIFRREKGWYILDLGSDQEAIANAECNTGTLRVENAITGYTLWTFTEHPTLAPTTPKAASEQSRAEQEAARDMKAAIAYSASVDALLKKIIP